MRAGIAVLVLFVGIACGDDSDAQEDPPTMRRTTAGADIQLTEAPEPRPASQWCARHGACCESLLRVSGAGGQPRSCFDLPRQGTPETEPQCSEALGRIANSLRARSFEVPVECR